MTAVQNGFKMRLVKMLTRSKPCEDVDGSKLSSSALRRIEKTFLKCLKKYFTYF